MPTIELPASWAGVAEPLRALMAELEREVHADHTTMADVAAVSARWAQVREAIRAAVRVQVDAKAAPAQTSKR